MTPEQLNNLTELEIVAQPSLTYKLDFNNKRISGMIDDTEAILQAVYKALNTERCAYVIYTSQYGVELERLVGQDYDFIVSDLERTITEALLIDDRITGVSNFTVQKTAVDSLLASFTVNSVFGSIPLELGVQIV